MHLYKLVIAIGLSLVASVAQAQNVQRETPKYTTGEEVLQEYARWQDKLRQDKYYLEPNAELSKPSPIRQAFLEFCEQSYETLLEYSPPEGMKCAKLIGKRKEAEYLLTRVRRQAAERAAYHAKQAQALSWLNQMIEQAEQTGCQEAVNHYENYLTRLDEITPETATPIYRHGQEKIAHCREDEKRFEQKMSLAKQEYQTLVSEGYLDDAAKAAMRIDDLNRRGFSVNGAKPDSLLKLQECVEAEASSGRKKRNTIATMRRKAALKGAKEKKKLEAQLQAVENALVKTLGKAQDAEAEAEANLATAEDKAAAQAALDEAKKKREKAEEALAAVRNTNPVSATKKWSELGDECKTAVQLASTTRQFCIANKKVIRRSSNVLEERCLLFIGAREQAKIVDSLQSLHGLSFYVETQFAKPRDKANLDEQNFIKEAVLRELNPMIKAYGGKVSSRASLYLTVKMVVTSAGKDLAKRRVDLVAWRWERTRGGKPFKKTYWRDHRQVVEEKGLDTGTAAANTRDLSRVLFSALVAHLTSEAYH